MEDNNTKGTIYQQLSSLFSNNNFNAASDNSFSKEINGVNKKIIIKGNNPNDVVRKGLELQQRKDLENKFFRNSDRSFQKSLQYEAARLPAYIDYEGMEFYPIISAALDLFMEEATTIGYNGKMLNIYSKKDRVKKALEELFYDTINVNVNLPFWIRNLTKYGDNFILLYGERKKGITHAKQMVNYEIERYDKIKDGKPSVIFKDRMTGDEFNSFEVAHFRLLGDDKYIPYGSCLLSNTYVKTNNGVKEIKDILVGDVVIGFDINTQNKIEANVLDIVCNGEKNIFKVSTNHNYINVTENHKIPYYDYNDKQFKEKLVSDLKIGDGLIINNNDDYNTLVKINKSINIKENNGRIYDDFADNLKNIPDYVDEDFAKLFGFLVGDGGVNNKRPYMVYFAYGMHETINSKYIQLLEKYSNKNIYLRKNKTYCNGIASAVVNSKSLATVLSNMGFIGNSRTKRIPKWVFSTSKEIRKAFLDGIMDADGCVNIDKWECKRFQIELANYDLINDIKLLAQSLGYKTGSINQRKPRKNIIINGNKVINISDSFVLYFYESINTQLISSDIENRKTNEFIIEKIKSIEPNGNGFVYDIYVDNENHNFYANNIVVHNSILNKVRRVFRQLIMAEDAMLTYRIIRAGEKKVFKIDIGNIDEDDVEEYIHKVATKFKRVGQVAPNDGQIDYRFNILGNDEDYFLPVRNANTLTGIDTLPGACLSLDTKINLLDGRLLKLIDIIDEFNLGKSLWTYSINPTSGEIVPSPITWAGITRKNTDVLKITLDNGESFTCTPDHKIPTKYNGVKEAKDLIINESLWAFNKQFKTIKNSGNEYEMIYNHHTNSWEYTHRVVDNFVNGVPEKNTIRHHVNLNRYDNTPNNIQRVTAREHFLIHSKVSIIGSNAYKEKYENDNNFKLTVDKHLLNGRHIYHNKLKNDSEFRNKVTAKQSNSTKKYINSLSDVDFKKRIDRLHTEEATLKSVETYKNNPNRLEYIEIARQNSIITKNKPENKLIYSENTKKLWKNKEFAKKITEKQKYKYDAKLLDLLINYYNMNNNLAIILDRYINNCESEFLTIFKKLNGENKQFKKTLNLTRNNIDKMLKFYGYLNWRDFTKKIPQYNHKVISIEYLDTKIDTGTITVDGNEQYHNYHNFPIESGIFVNNSNLNDIHDIEYLRDNLFIGLGIPKPFLSFQDAAGAGKNMAQYDIRFAKKVVRIQQAAIQELNKMAIIHLFLLGFSNEDLNDFELTLTNPSIQQELLKSELLREKAQTYTELTRGENGIAAMSHTEAKRVVFNYSDSQIVEDLKQQKMEKVVMQELADAPVLIKKSGLFADIDKKFGQETALIGEPSGGTENGGIPPMGNDMGGGMPPMGNDMGGQPNSPAGGMPPAEPMGGGMNTQVPPISEDISRYMNNVNRLVYGDGYQLENVNEKSTQEIILESMVENNKLNNNAKNMITEIDDLLNNDVNEFDGIDFENIN